MESKPTPEELFVIDSKRKEMNDRTGLTYGGKINVIAQIPMSVYKEMEKQHGSTWTNKDSILAPFLCKNPQYRLGIPEV